MTIRLLTMTSLFPNAQMPRHGIFVRERLRHLVLTQPVKAFVVAPVPWFPSAHPLWGRYAKFAATPTHEILDDLDVYHPRFAAIPGFGNALSPFTMASAARRCLMHNGAPDFDAVDAHYAFPDGVAAILLAGWLGKPVVVTVRGSDMNILPHQRAAGWWLRRTLSRCDAVIAVSEALADRVECVAPQLKGRIRVLRNGVDRERFVARSDRRLLRQELFPDGATILSVGNLVPLKGHDVVIEALGLLPGVHAAIVGSGPEERALKELAERLGLAARVRFLGNVAQGRLVELYNAADVTVLASSSEGLPNVVLESLACGTPVVASNVGGVAEILTSSDAGTLVSNRTPRAFADAISSLLERVPASDTVRAQVASFGWERTSAGIYSLFSDILATRLMTCATGKGGAR